jgi:hypothetical protein
MKSSSLPVRDLEQLSAYLDGQLNDAEQRALRARLMREPGLQQALGELRQVREALRALPPVRPPRNFTLTPSMIGQAAPRATRGPALAWASALASLAFVVLAAVDLVGGGLAASRQAAPAAELQMAPALLAAPSEPEVRGAADNAFNPTAPGVPPYAGTPSVSDSSLSQTGSLGAGVTASATATPAPGAQEKYAAASETPTPVEAASLRSMTLPTPSAITLGETTFAQTAATETLGPKPAAEQPASAEAPPGGVPWLNPLRILEVAMAVLALVLAAAALRARRSRR